MFRRRFTRLEIHTFQMEVATGATQRDVARKHGFSPSNFPRWFAKHGRPHVSYEPTAAERALAARWREETTRAGSWEAYRSFASSSPWSDDADLPFLDDQEDGPNEFEHLKLHARSDARVLLVCEKMHVQGWLEEWRGPRCPSAAHATKTAIAWLTPLASSWAARTLSEHASSLGAQMAFFGDLDPQAIHSFAALRAGGRRALLQGTGKPICVSWIGLDSQWLDWLCDGLRVEEVPIQLTVRLGWLGEQYWQLVKRLVPDVRRLIGKRGYDMLERGLKVEADALRGEPFVNELGRRLRRCARAPI